MLRRRSSDPFFHNIVNLMKRCHLKHKYCLCYLNNCRLFFMKKKPEPPMDEIKKELERYLKANANKKLLEDIHKHIKYNSYPAPINIKQVFVDLFSKLKR